MTVKQLIERLKLLPQDAIVDMASDEEGNSFSDIGEGFAEAILAKGHGKNSGKKVFTLYPEGQEDGTERYEE